MFPRNLVARSGRSGESIVLLDERGCPTDESIVEGFRPEDRSGSRLVAPFEVFKFYDDPVVRFQLTVQFCLEQCRPVSPLISRRDLHTNLTRLLRHWVQDLIF